MEDTSHFGSKFQQIFLTSQIVFLDQLDVQVLNSKSSCRNQIFEFLDTRVALKGDNSDEFETLMLFTATGITLKCKFNGADEAIVAVDEATATFG